MSEPLQAAIVLVLAINPAYAVARFAGMAAGDRRRDLRTAAIACGAALALLLAAIGLRGAVLGAMGVWPETFRVGAGLIMLAGAIEGLWRGGRVGTGDGSAGRWTALSPLAFPALAGPAALAAAIAYADRGGAIGTGVAGAVAIGVAFVTLLLVQRSMARPSTGSGRAGGSGAVVSSAVRLLAVLLILGAVEMILDGVESV